MPDCSQNPGWSDRQLDALREVANIGAGHAATALSQMTSHTIMISVPQIVVSRQEDVTDLLGDPDQTAIVVTMHMLGDLTGKVVLVLSQDDGRLLSDFLLRRDSGATSAFGEMEISSLKEAANVLTGAYLNALSEFMGMMLLPSVPTLTMDKPSVALEPTFQQVGDQREFVMTVETNFNFLQPECVLTGHFLLLPDAASLGAMFDAVGVS